MLPCVKVAYASKEQADPEVSTQYDLDKIAFVVTITEQRPVNCMHSRLAHSLKGCQLSTIFGKNEGRLFEQRLAKGFLQELFNRPRIIKQNELRFSF